MLKVVSVHLALLFVLKKIKIPQINDRKDAIIEIIWLELLIIHFQRLIIQLYGHFKLAQPTPVISRLRMFSSLLTTDVEFP